MKTHLICLALLGAALLAAPAAGQDVIVKGDWTYAPPELYGMYGRERDIIRGDVSEMLTQERVVWDALHHDRTLMTLFSARATATTYASPQPTQSEFDIFHCCLQTFTLSEPAQVVMTGFLKGSLSSSFFVDSSYGCSYTVDASVDVGWDFRYRLAFGNPKFYENSVYQNQTAGPFEKFLYSEVTLPAGNYAAQANFWIHGASNPDVIDASVTTDFGPSTRGGEGLAVSIAAYPAGLGSSRDAVRAPAARARFGVDGTGVQVGLLEAGEPYAHSALDGRLEVKRGNQPSQLNDFRREHALATAGIIAGSDADAGNAGIAPGATILSAPLETFTSSSTSSPFHSAVNALLSANLGLKVMSMSAGADEADAKDFINTTINQHPDLTFVKSAGNDGRSGPETITSPGRASNIITVGAVNRTFGRRADFSSYDGPAYNPAKPDLVAPGEFINAPRACDVNGDGQVNDFGRTFLGDDFHGSLVQEFGYDPTTGPISGTSFAAPHVAGAAALLYQYQSLHANHSADHRVMKAVLLNSASTNVTHSDGAPWTQAAHAVPGTTVVTRSLDEELGAGMLDVYQALVEYEPQEVLPGANNGAANFNIHAENRLFFWDLEQVNGDGGMVNYLLGPVSDQHVRITLTWDVDAAGGSGLMPLELRLYREDDPELAGFDPLDLLLVETSNVGENVKLLDLTIPGPDLGDSPEIYVQVINTGATVTEFGLAAAVPEPASICLLAAGGLALLRRSRRK